MLSATSKQGSKQNSALFGMILAAGQGTRMRSKLPKVLHEILGRPLLDAPICRLQELSCAQTVVVIGTGADQVRQAFADAEVSFALQDPPNGTGDAVRVGLEALPGGDGTVIILNGDLPLLTRPTIEAMLAEHRRCAAAMTLLALELQDPSGYGRLVQDDAGHILEIVEEADANVEQLQLRMVNGGLYICDLPALRAGLQEWIKNGVGNSQGEIYLPPVIGPIRQAGGIVAAYTLNVGGEPEELQQVNNRVELAKATAIRKRQIIEAHQLSGVTIVDPVTTWIEEGVVIGADTVIHPSTVLRSGVVIGESCQVGPFAHLRVDTELSARAEIGNFVEVKKSRLGPDAKAKHLSYIGDAEIGAGVNIGAGTVFANYDGKKKSKTVVGDGAFIGSGTILVAPTTVGKRAKTGAGAVITRNSVIDEDAVVVGVPAKVINRRKAQD